MVKYGKYLRLSEDGNTENDKSKSYASPGSSQ
jgi:hypothetical protein